MSCGALPLVLLATTVGVELALLALLRRPKPRVLDVALANLLTHPAAFWAVGYAGCGFVSTEFAVVSVEAVVYATLSRLDWREALALSGILNVTTALLGIVIGTIVAL